MISSITCGDVVADHALIQIALNSNKPVPPRQTITTRRIASIDTSSFQSDLSIRLSDLDLPDDVHACFNAFNNDVESVLDQHAPSLRKTVSVRPKVPWFNNNILCAKRVKRRAG